MNMESGKNLLGNFIKLILDELVDNFALLVPLVPFLLQISQFQSSVTLP